MSSRVDILTVKFIMRKTRTLICRVGCRCHPPTTLSKSGVKRRIHTQNADLGIELRADFRFQIALSLRSEGVVRADLRSDWVGDQSSAFWFLLHAVGDNG